MALFDFLRVLPRPTKDPVKNARQRDLAAKFVDVKILWLNAGINLAYVTRNPYVAEKLYDKILVGIEELCELERNFPGLLDPPPEELMAMIEKTKQIRLAEMTRQRPQRPAW